MTVYHSSIIIDDDGFRENKKSTKIKIKIILDFYK